MKKTEFARQIHKDNRKYNAVKLKSFLLMKFSLGERRKKRESAYSIFENYHSFDKYNNSLPDGKYFKPTDIILYDLIKKEDLLDAKNGLVKLFKKCYCHKYIWGGKSENDIDDLITGLDQKLNSAKSWYNIGIFDYAYDSTLESYIDHFTIHFRNFSSSYAAIEVQIVLATSFVNEIAEFTKNQYKKPGMCIHRHWGGKRGKSGAKIQYGISSGVQSEHAKSQLIYEQLQYVKAIFLKELKKYFSLLQVSRDGKIYGINVFETNITYTDKLDSSVYDALGLDEKYGFNFSPAERLYVSTKTLHTLDSYESDMMFLFNPDLVDDFEAYSSAHNKALCCLTMDYMEELYRGVILKNLGIEYMDLISWYRNLVNKDKPYKRNHRRLLKLKYLFNKDFYDFKKVDEELPVDEELECINTILKNDSFTGSSIYRGFHTAEVFAGAIEWIWKQIRINYKEVENDLNRKLEISDSLNEYSIGASNRILVSIQVILAIFTFYLLIFPDKAEKVASWLQKLREILPR